MTNDHSSAVAAALTLHPRLAGAVRAGEAVSQVVGVTLLFLIYGQLGLTPSQQTVMSRAVAGCMAYQALGTGLRYFWSLRRASFLDRKGGVIALCSAWFVGVVVTALVPWPATMTAGERVVLWSELMLGARAALGLVVGLRRIAAATQNPALSLVLSFVAIIALGTSLLMLPWARVKAADGSREGAPLLVAAFTATSACCVTGLAVVPTGSYWSRTGHLIILAMIQIGGLGIITCGAFFGLFARDRLALRETVTLQNMLDAEHLRDVRKLLVAVVGFTVLIELVGAMLMMTLWPELPWRQRFFWGMFHAVSAFCNAGFALDDAGFLGMATRWQVWGVLSALVIFGGLGFSVLLEGINHTRRWWANRRGLWKSRERLGWSLSSRIIVVTTTALLLGGTLAIGLLELQGPGDVDPATRVADAWFQSVLFRTAGFNSVDHAALQPATKFVAILLMFIGASPGSTGGGVKTVSFAVMVLAVVAVFRGRPAVELRGRTIPDTQVRRVLTIISLSLLTVVVSTLLLVIIERQPERFLDHLFEATSAFATVGASAGLTPSLHPLSQWVLLTTMFFGRVGPVTLLLALAGRTREAHYEYPPERLILG